MRTYSFSLVAPISFFRVVGRYLPTYFPPPPSSTYLCSSLFLSLSLSNNQSCSFLANITASPLLTTRGPRKRKRREGGERKIVRTGTVQCVHSRWSGFLVTSIIIPVYPSEQCPRAEFQFYARALLHTRAYSAVVVGAAGRVGEKSKPTGFANHPPGRDRARGRRIRGVRLVDRHSRGSSPGDK